MKRGTIREVFPPLEKTDCFMMRLTPQDKASLRTAARRAGTSMSAYLLRLHHYAIGTKRDDRAASHSAG